MTALLLDTETNGLFRYDRRADQEGQPRMASLAAMLVDDEGNAIKDMYRLIKPEGWEANHIADAKAGTNAFAVNGLKWEDLNDKGVPVAEALAEYDAFVDECKGIAAYGVTFDQKVVRAEERRANRNDRYGERPTFCIMRAATDLCKMAPTDKMMAAGRKWNKQPKLAEAVEILLGRTLEGAHNAEVDLEATREIYAIMLGKPGVVVWKEQVSKLDNNEN